MNSPPTKPAVILRPARHRKQRWRGASLVAGSSGVFDYPGREPGWEMQKKARLVGVALNPHQRRTVEETSRVGGRSRCKCYVECIMAAPRAKVNYFLCVAESFFSGFEGDRRELQKPFNIHYIDSRIGDAFHYVQRCSFARLAFFSLIMLRRSMMRRCACKHLRLQSAT